MRKYSSSYQKLFKATLAASVATGAFVSVAPLSTHANETGPALFKDLNEKAHYYGPVLNLSARGIVRGYSDGTYKPNNSVTRGQAAKILANTLGLDTVNVQNPGFTDVKTTDEYYGPIAALAQAGIINGYDDKTFRPNNNLKRSQMAKIITLGFGLEESELTDNRFSDVKSSDAYAGYVQALLTNNITTGTTATTFEPNALVTRGQIASFVVRSESAVSVQAPVNVTSEILNITNNTVELANGNTYRLATSVKSLVNPTNLAVLKGATITVTAQDGQIGKVTSIEITASGNDTNHLELDGKGAALAGDVKVNGDYVSIKNIVVEGNLEIANNVKNSFLSDGITVKGKTIISDENSATTANNEGKMYRTIAFVKPFIGQTAAEEATNKPVIIFSNSAMGTIEVSKNDVVIEATGTTNVQAFVVSASVHLKASAGVTIPQVTIAEGVTSITIDAPVTNLVINTQTDLKIEGTGDLGEITIASNNVVKFETTGKVDNVVITSKDSKVEFGAITKVGNLVLPEGVEAKDVIGNYEQVKGNIDTIGGDKKPVPSTPPTTQPSTPPTTGDDGGTTTPQPDQGAIDRAAAAHVNALFTALPAADSVTVAHKAQITAARTSYNRLTAAQKNLVNTAKLVAAEAALAKAESAAAVAKVKGLIIALPEADAVTVDHKGQIETALAEYGKLEPAQKDLVDTAKLVAAEAALAEAVSQAAVAHVNGLINALPNAIDVTVSDSIQIKEAREAYDKLSESQQNQIEIAKLTEAEAALEIAKEKAANEKAAAPVTKLISELPEAANVTLDQKEEVQATRQAYKDLTDKQKALVIGVEKLEEVEAALLAIEREIEFNAKLESQLSGFKSDLLAFSHFGDNTNQVTYEILEIDQPLVDIEGTGFLDALLQVTEIRILEIGNSTIEIYNDNGELTNSAATLKINIGRAVLEAIGKGDDYGSTMGDLVNQPLHLKLYVNDNGTQFEVNYTFKFATLLSSIKAANEIIADLEEVVENAENGAAAQALVDDAKEKVEVVRKLDPTHDEISAWDAIINAQQSIVDKMKALETAIKEAENAMKDLEAAVSGADSAAEAKSYVDNAKEKVKAVKDLDKKSKYTLETTEWDEVISAQQLVVKQKENEEALQAALVAAVKAAEEAVLGLPDAVKNAKDAATAQQAVKDAQEKVKAVIDQDLDNHYVTETVAWNVIISEQQEVVDQRYEAEEEEEAAKAELQAAIDAAENAINGLAAAVYGADNAAAAKQAVDYAQEKIDTVKGLTEDDKITNEWDAVITAQLAEVEKRELKESFDQGFINLTKGLKSISGSFDHRENKIDISIPTDSQSMGATQLFTGTGLKLGILNVLLSPETRSVSVDNFMIDTLQEGSNEKKTNLSAIIDDLAFDWVMRENQGVEKEEDKIKLSTEVEKYLLGKPKELVVSGHLKDGTIYSVKYTLEFN